MAGLPNQPMLETNTTPNLLLKMKNDGRAECTIFSTGKRLRIIAKNVADINNPEAVRSFIARHQCTDTYKQILATTYDSYCKFNGIQWNKPHYKGAERNIQVPTKEKLDLIIGHAHRVLSVKLQLSLRGLRPIEVVNLRVKDIDFTQRLITPTTAKHGKGRTLTISPELNAMLQEYCIRRNLKTNDKLFNITSRSYSKMFRMSRNNLADKLHDPTLKNIRLYDFRHYFATMLYKKTNNLLQVMQQLGHRDIKNTIIYTHLINIETDEYDVQATQDRKIGEQLLKDGWEYQYTTPDSYLTYRKRK
jgi:integrase